MLGRELGEQRLVERLGEARVGDGDVEAALGEQVGGLERLLDAGAVAEQRDLRAPSRRISPVPISIGDRGSAGSGTPSAAPRG